MKCSQCGTKNDPNSKFCKECGTVLAGPAGGETLTSISELYGKEVEVIFFIENYTGKISGIVNPTEDQVGRYRQGILQKVVIENPANNEPDENIGAVLTFIRQSKEYLGEAYNESHYRNFSTVELKKEYLKLFERILREKSKRSEPKPTPPAPPEKK